MAPVVAAWSWLDRHLKDKDSILEPLGARHRMLIW